MNFKKKEIDYINKLKAKGITKYSKIASKLLEKDYCVGKKHRTIRKAVSELINNKVVKSTAKVLIYDIETPRVKADLWWSGKQYVHGTQINGIPNIITIAWKWLGEKKVHSMEWDKNQSDEELIKAFAKEYNKADMVIGFNNNRFDNKWLNTRAVYYNININTHVKSLDLMKQAKNILRVPSYSMNAIAKMMGVTTKLQHSGLSMWEAIQYGSKADAKEAMKMMLEYNEQDINVTEAVYLRLRRYIKHPIHVGRLIGEDKYSCGSCGSTDLKLYKETFTQVGTKQYLMECNCCQSVSRISETMYNKYN